MFLFLHFTLSGEPAMGLTLLGAGLPRLIPELKINPVPHYCGHLLASFFKEAIFIKIDLQTF